ncbi:MAG: Gfo/Idh/MocA family oxidoreductase [Phycisphaerales bacterium]|nr:Gfo/Idh/MocA family oxidoreductase [Phycisphaerales bacterium]
MSKQPTIGVGVIGLGFMGRTHLAAFNACPGCEVVAVADRDASRLKSRGDVGGNFDTGAEAPAFDEDVVSTFEDALELIEHPDVELVSVTTPTPTHRDLARAVMGAGRHLLLEKPVDLDPLVIDELAEEARKSGVLAMPAHCMRFWPAWAWMKRHLDAGTHGRPVRATFKRTGAAPGWNREFYFDDELSGGAIIDLHIHDVDFIRHCFGMPEAVSASGSRRHVITEYDFGEGGVQVSAEGGWLEDDDAPFTMRCTIECTHGTMDFDLARSPEIEVVARDGVRSGQPEASEGGTGYDGEVRAMVAAVRDGATSPPVRLEDAADVARILAAEVASLKSDGEVVVEHGP